MKKLDIFTSLILFVILFQTQLAAQEQQRLPGNPNNHRIICFGNKSHMTYTDFMLAKDTSSFLQAIDSIYSFEYIDPDNCPFNYIAYKAIDLEYPLLIVVDENGNIYGGAHGGLSEKEIERQIFLSDSVSKPLAYSDLQKIWEKKENHSKKRDFFTKIRAKRINIDLSAGYINLWYSDAKPFSGSSSDGFSVAIHFRKGVAKRVSVLSGLDFDLYGGKIDGEIIKEPTFRIPIAAEVSCCAFPLLFSTYQELVIRAGIWGGYGLKDNKFEIRRWNGGYSLEIGLKSGSFDLHLGYDRGIINRFSSNAPYSSIFTNALKIGFRIRVGD